MRARHHLYLYLAVLPAPTFIHDPQLLGAALLFALAATGAGRWHILRRSIMAMFAFNLSVSLGVVLIGTWRGDIDTDWLLLANLRVLLMVYLGFWFVTRTNLLDALAGWPTVTLIVTLAQGQARAFARTVQEFRLAFTSRSIGRPRLLDRRHNASAQTIALLDKAQAQSTEVALAMRSRGAFDA